MNDIVFCRGGGCTAKLGAGVLSKVLSQIPKTKDENLIIGYDSSDDAAVYKLTDDLAMVQTLDFFPPMIEDPYLFGQIAATNALSDIYAMGGQVKTALNIVCFPDDMDMNILGKILLGGSEKVQEAGGVLAGGHSIADSEIKYGLSVTGIINPNKIRPNNGCKEGDLLLLTKPLGVGIVCTAHRVGEAQNEDVDIAVQCMTTLNRYSAECADAYRINACTDVTGFGLLGHLNEMITAAYSAEIWSDHIPYIAGARKYAEEFLLTGGGQRNRNHLKGKVRFEKTDFAMEELLFDPQTSGGLLFSVDKHDASNLLKDIEKLGLPCAIIGTVTQRKDINIIIK